MPVARLLVMNKPDRHRVAAEFRRWPDGGDDDEEDLSDQ